MSDLPKAVVLFSGGLDSTTLLFTVMESGYTPIALSVDYGQRHHVELVHAQKITERWKVLHLFAPLQRVAHLLQNGSSLVGTSPVPEGHYAAENMKQTVVPNRNAIMLAIAYAVAIREGAAKVCTAVHAGDHAIYPDCRPEFIRAFEEMQRQAITREIYGMKCPDLYAPFVLMSKAQIVKHGREIGVPYNMTWSCYNGDEKRGHCGRCGTCVERIEAFKLAGVPDPTIYADKEYANQVLDDFVRSRQKDLSEPTKGLR